MNTSDRLPPEIIDIPTRVVASAASSIVIDRFRANGIDPAKAITNPMCRTLALEWSRGKMNVATFDHCCRNMLILNPSLSA